MVATDVETCVGEDDPSNEGVDPNPSGQIGVTAAVSAKDTALQVAALTDQVGLLTDMVKTLLSARDLVTPPALPTAILLPKRVNLSHDKLPSIGQVRSKVSVT